MGQLANHGRESTSCRLEQKTAAKEKVAVRKRSASSVPLPPRPRSLHARVEHPIILEWGELTNIVVPMGDLRRQNQHLQQVIDEQSTTMRALVNRRISCDARARALLNKIVGFGDKLKARLSPRSRI
jgi:hypothetical protein